MRETSVDPDTLVKGGLALVGGLLLTVGSVAFLHLRNERKHADLKSRHEVFVAEQQKAHDWINNQISSLLAMEGMRAASRMQSELAAQALPPTQRMPAYMPSGHMAHMPVSMSPGYMYPGVFPG